MSTIFEKIIAGDIPANFIWKDDVCVAFMDVNPTTTGHCLVVPRIPVDHFYDLPEDVASHVFLVTQKISRTAHRVFDCSRVGVVLAGYGVPHTHIHVIPINSEKDLSPETHSGDTPEEITAAATALRCALIEDGYNEATETAN